MDDPVNVIDGAMDAMYFICQVLTFAHPDLDYTRIWKLVHKANLSKFTEKGHLDKDGKKWIKPPDFVAPDDEIRQVIQGPRKKIEKSKPLLSSNLIIGLAVGFATGCVFKLLF
jgi:predicted HAD superfamily Cof-like phosphohydrolase